VSQRKPASDDGLGLPRVDAAGDAKRAWQELWVAVQASPWTSLAIVPAVSGLSVAEVARALAEVGGEYHGRTIELIDARGLAFGGARELVERLSAPAQPHAAVAVLDCPLDSQAALLVARAASAALLVVPVGRARLADAQRVLESVGRSSFIGAVTLASSEP
jgi:hypothetical protein